MNMGISAFSGAVKMNLSTVKRWTKDLEALEYPFKKENGNRVYGARELKVFIRIQQLREVNTAVPLSAIFKHVVNEAESGKLDEVSEKKELSNEELVLQELRGLKEQIDYIESLADLTESTLDRLVIIFDGKNNIIEQLGKITSLINETQIFTLINQLKITEMARAQGIPLRDEKEYAKIAIRYLETFHNNQKNLQQK